MWVDTLLFRHIWALCYLWFGSLSHDPDRVAPSSIRGALHRGELPQPCVFDYPIISFMRTLKFSVSITVRWSFAGYDGGWRTHRRDEPT